ncbi:MAG: hypothetical protein Q4B69_06955 [Slackia sp.]|nr:hypothetical protein [Slackia sp.]
MATSGNPNIIPFDDARRMATRSSRAAAERVLVDAGRPLDGTSYRSQNRADMRGAPHELRLAGGRASDGAWPLSSGGSFSSRALGDARTAESTRSSLRGDRALATPVRSAASEFFDDPAYREGYSRAALEVYDPDLADEEERASGSSRSDRARSKRRAKTKQKANRLFDRQFGTDADPSPHSSRAAVYKGEMGRSHKRAFADLNTERGRASAGLGASSARAARAASRDRARVSLLSVLVAVAGCFALAAALLFPAARQLYIETREQARLQAEYDALSARNQAIEGHLEYLKTDEGIEDVVHKELGWVHDGQVAGVVQGLAGGEATAGQAMIAQVKSGSIPAPETWYSPVLDAVFGYVDPVTAMPENTDLSNVSDVAADRPEESADGGSQSS